MDEPLAQFCIQLLVDKISGLISRPDGSENRSEELRHLRLTLLSTDPSISLPSPLLGQLLSAIDLVIRNGSLEQERYALLAAMYQVILREVGGWKAGIRDAMVVCTPEGARSSGNHQCQSTFVSAIVAHVHGF